MKYDNALGMFMGAALLGGGFDILGPEKYDRDPRLTPLVDHDAKIRKSVEKAERRRLRNMKLEVKP